MAFIFIRGGVMVLKNPFEYEFVKEGGDFILRINAVGIARVPSIEEEEIYMEKAIELLIQNPSTTKIVFLQRREYEYDYEQVKLLKEIAIAFKKLSKESEKYSFPVLSRFSAAIDANAKYAFLHNLIFNVLKKDVLLVYVTLKREIRNERIRLDIEKETAVISALYGYIKILEEIVENLKALSIIRILEHEIAGLKDGDRAPYTKVLKPTIKPDFLYTKLMASYPRRAKEIDAYRVGRSEIVVFQLEDDIQYLYHLIPPEFKISEDKYSLIDAARQILSEHKPEKQEFLDPERMRSVFYNIGKDLLTELASQRDIEIDDEDLEDLAEILIRYTIGFGFIELLLQDPKIQDITVNSPTGENPIFVIHEDYGECKTNIIPSLFDIESWATKLRILSGRPLDEADPILDTEIYLPSIANARVGVIAPPLNPTGIAYAFRRHRDKPWTFPLFIKQKMINPLSAGLLSFIIDGNRTILVAGTRSAGKTSLLGSVLVEVMRKYRIITIEDTLELPGDALRKFGYNIQQMKVAGALSKGETEVSATDGIRTTLRLGDSALIVGEVRSEEAKALYEAMRVGALANLVAGTIHGDSPYGVFDRVVNDLKVPKTSFKATDIIIVANPVRSADGLHRWRRVTQITEVRKVWEEDPVAEGGFVDLMKYNSETDSLEPTDDLINGNSEILKSIAANVKEWAGNWEAVWQNILLRARIKEAMVKKSEEVNDPDLLEAEAVILTNDMFHRISENVKEKEGWLNPDRIYEEWVEWLDTYIEKRKAVKRLEKSVIEK